MKKKIILVMTVLCIGCGMGLTSCKKSNKALIEEINNTNKEGLKAMKEGDGEKCIKLMNKVKELNDELSKRQLTDEERNMIKVGSVEQVDEVLNEE